MKKFAYLCAMIMLSLNMMAQIDLNDSTWKKTFCDEFTVNGRAWDTLSFLSSDKKWRAYPGEGVTHGKNHMVFQFSQCQFNDANDMIKLVAEYDYGGKIPDSNYYLPKWMWISEGGPGYPKYDSLWYFSGDIDARKDSVIGHDTKFLYGYFEIRCKLPVHQGAFPAFWLHSASNEQGNSFYASLDIFEYSWNITKPKINPNTPEYGSNRCYTCAVHFNDTSSTNYDSDIYAKAFPIIPSNSSGLDNFHTFSCEWLPDHVIWYFDGIEMNRYDNPDHIPNRPLTLKTSYSIDDYCLDNNGIVWYGPGEMLIDYIRVYQLNWDCSTDETITCQSDLDGFDHAVKKSVAITSTIDEPVVESGNKFTFRVTDSFEVTGPFTVDNGAEFTVIQQLCPPSNNEEF